MTTFAKALGKKFEAQKEEIRIRSFEMNGHTFKVKVPLTIETDLMYQRMKVVNQDIVKKYYDELTAEIIANKDKNTGEIKITFEDNDVIIENRSMREAATNKALTELRITEMFKMLVPEEKEFDMETITYEMIDELFPFAVQMQIIDRISQTISPSYTESKGK
jgi:6-pyruvoyl-tetrahydropterin synthase